MAPEPTSCITKITIMTTTDFGTLSLFIVDAMLLIIEKHKHIRCWGGTSLMKERNESVCP